jgi:translation initiation factor IF-2
MITVRRGKEVVFDGKLDSLRRMKDIVKELGSGYECGVGSEFTGWKEGDKVEAYELLTKRVILPMRADVAAAAVERAEKEKALAAAAAS